MTEEERLDSEEKEEDVEAHRRRLAEDVEESKEDDDEVEAHKRR
jgi:hypothetical protein